MYGIPVGTPILALKKGQVIGYNTLEKHVSRRFKVYDKEQLAPRITDPHGLILRPDGSLPESILGIMAHAGWVVFKMSPKSQYDLILAPWHLLEYKGVPNRFRD